MRKYSPIRTLMCFRAIICFGAVSMAITATQAHAAGQPIERREKSSSLLDVIPDRLTRLGEATRDFLTPGFNPLGELHDMTGLREAPREVIQNAPIRPGGLISIHHENGEVRVEVWDNPIVQVVAEIFAGAETTDIVQEVVEAISVDVTSSHEGVSIKTQYPDTQELGAVVKFVNYIIRTPSNVRVASVNSLGDTLIQGIRGDVTVDARLGVVDIRDIDGPVHVRAMGEWPVQAHNLRQGGTFELLRSRAEFNKISGNLKIYCFLGSVLLHDLGAELNADVTVDSGRLQLTLPDSAQPNLSAIAWFGSIKSDYPINPRVSGNIMQGDIINQDARQRISLETRFGDIEVIQASGSRENIASSARLGEYTESIIERELSISPDTEVVVDAMVGNISIVGTDNDTVSIRARQRIQMLYPAYTPAAMSALTLDTQVTEGRVRIKTSKSGDLESLGCTFYRMDLTIQIPREAPLRITAQNGHTLVENMHALVTILQDEGTVEVRNSTAAVDVTNKSGDIRVHDTAAEITLTADRGAVETLHIFGRQRIHAAGGRTVIDAPGADIILQQRGGSVHIVPLDGIAGNFNIATEEAPVTILIPETSDAAIMATVQNGRITSAFPLSGEIDRAYQRFWGRRSDGGPGAYQVVIETKDADIIID